jgi:hypothetical protein
MPAWSARCLDLLQRSRSSTCERRIASGGSVTFCVCNRSRIARSRFELALSDAVVDDGDHAVPSGAAVDRSACYRRSHGGKTEAENQAAGLLRIAFLSRSTI